MSYKIAMVWSTAFMMTACGSSTGPSGSDGPAEARPAPSTAPVRVDLAVNGHPMGSFACNGAIVVATSATNLSAAPIDLQRLSVRFTPQGAGCVAHEAPISPDLSGALPAGGTAEVRRLDAAGTLCGEPYGAPQCSWKVTAELTTSAGTAAGTTGVATFRAATEGCDGVPVPDIVAPASGATLTGTVNVWARISESAYCIISARTIVEAFSADGAPAFVSYAMDLGDHYPWDTRRVRNGRYWLASHQSCCYVRSAPVVVTVQN